MLVTHFKRCKNNDRDVMCLLLYYLANCKEAEEPEVKFVMTSDLENLIFIV